MATTFLVQYFTCSQTFAHFFRHLNGRPQTTQIFCGRLVFLWTIAAICSHGPSQIKDVSVAVTTLLPQIKFLLLAVHYRNRNLI